MGPLDPLPAASIPASPDGWSSSLADLAFLRAVDDLARFVEQVRSAFFASDASGLRIASTRLADGVAATTHDLWCPRRARVRGRIKVAADFALLAAAVDIARLAALGLIHTAADWVTMG
ncbi:hypothetical protein [Frankia sp. Cj5]|uniref:hypothetical protein n=1 Tax=Frankia sp. Cj5 TaxID=2880978 RepID=UPI001EF6228E|nr:hypothetical protein [Frankia sp. Cj5]